MLTSVMYTLMSIGVKKGLTRMHMTIRNTLSGVSQSIPPLRTLQEQASRRSLLPPLSTYWMPLSEFIEQWAAFGTTVTPPLALSAAGHAFFALSHERRAHQHFCRVAREQTSLSSPAIWSRWQQSERGLHKALHNWSSAAFCLDQLLHRDVPAEEEETMRTHARAARWQQERLWALLDEVRRDIATWRSCAEAADAGTTHAQHAQEAPTR